MHICCVGNACVAYVLQWIRSSGFSSPVSVVAYLGMSWYHTQVDLPHIRHFRRIQAHWQAYDAYARVCMAMGTNQSLGRCDRMMVLEALRLIEPLFWSDQWHPVATLMLDEHDWHSMPGAQIRRNRKNEMIMMKINENNKDIVIMGYIMMTMIYKMTMIRHDLSNHDMTWREAQDGTGIAMLCLELKLSLKNSLRVFRLSQHGMKSAYTSVCWMTNIFNTSINSFYPD